MHTINIVFFEFLLGLKNGYIFCARFIFPKEINFTRPESYWVKFSQTPELNSLLVELCCHIAAILATVIML